MPWPRDRFPSGTLVVRDGNIVYASEGIAAVSGRAVADLLGERFETFLRPDDRARVAERHARRLRGETVPREYEAELLLPDGSFRPIECHIERDGGDFLVHVRDLSTHANRRLRLDALAALGAAIQREQTADAVHLRTRRGLAELGLASALFRRDGAGVRISHANVPPEVAEGFAARVGAPLEGYLAPPTRFTAEVWSEGFAFTDEFGPVVAAIVPAPHAEAVRGLVAARGLSRAAALRLDERGGATSCLVIAGDWLGPEDAPAIRLFGAQVAAALDAARTIADLSRRNADLAALDRIGALSGEAADLETFFARAAAILRDLAGCAGAAVFAVDDRDGALVRVFDGSGGEGGHPARVARDTPAGDVARSRAARLLPAEPAGAPADGAGRTVAWVPLVARSNVVGVLAVPFAAPVEVVRERLELLAAVAAHFASAMESHGLLDDLRRRVEELTLLNDVAMASAQLDPVLLLDNALRRVCETFQADTGAAFLREGERISLVAAIGLSSETARRVAQLAVGEGLPGIAVQRLTPVRSQEVPADPTTRAVAAAEGLASSVAVPLVAKSQTALGTIVFGRRTPRPTDEGELTLLAAVGAQLGVAVENARLFADVRRRLSDLEAVHALALRVFGNAPGDVQALLEDGCREAARALACRAAVVLLADAAGARLRGVAAWGAPFDATRIEIPLERDALAAAAIEHRAPAWSDDVTKDPRSVLFGKPGMPPLAMLVVPLTSRAATRGVLFLADDAGRAFTEAELALANALAGELAVGLENAELYADARARVEELSLLNEMGRTVAGSLDVQQVLRAGVDAARRLLGAGRGFVVLYDPLRAELSVGAGAGENHEHLLDTHRALDTGGICLRVIRDRRTVQVEDVAADPDVNLEYRQTSGARSLVAAPLLLRGEPLGVLVVDDARPRRWSAADVERLDAVANQLAVAIENARLYAEARERLSELSTVIDVARVVSSSLDLEEVLAAGADHLARTLQGTGCTILLEDHHRRELRRAASSGVATGPAAVSLDTPSLAGEALDARAPLASRGGATAGPALLAVPLHVRDQPVGVALVAAEPDRTFSPGELSRAMAIASQLAVAVDNARLYSETRRRAEELGLLHEVGRSLVATLEIEQVLDAGVRNLARMVDAPEAILALVGEDGSHLEIRAVYGGHPEQIGTRVGLRPTAGSLAALVVERREPVAIEDARTDARAAGILSRHPEARALLGLPLLVRDRSIGAAVIVDTRGPRRFRAAEVERAAAIANQLAVAAENARLYEDLRRSYAQLAQAQRQLIQQERLAALGELSAVVAHEVRNPLGVIFNSLGSLRRVLRPHGDAKMLLDIVAEEADRLNRIVGDLLDFARPSTPLLRPEPLERIVEEAVGVALAQNAAGVEVRREVDRDLPAVPMDARLVRQAVLNVAVNAVQAMPRGGTLTVRIRREARGVLLELEDTGAGIPEEVRGRIFEPFFTTKASGTGLGLAVVRRIVEGHGGEISVRSRPGAGTTFSLRFPLDGPAGGGTVEFGAGNG